MGFFDFVEDIGDTIGDAAESAYDTVAKGGIGKVISSAADVVDKSTFGLAGRALHATDDYVFDTVDYLSAGTLDVDFDDGKLSVGTGIDGVAHVGASIGEAGVTADSKTLVGGFDFRMTDQGFLASGSAGIDWGPLPYAAGHVQLDANGDVNINGQFQGTLPTPYGVFSGEGSAGFTSTDAGWGGYLNSQGSWLTPTGVTLGAGEHLSYTQTADGDSQLSVGVNGSVSYLGATVRGGVDYDRLEHDGDVVQGVHAEGGVDALGLSASAEADYQHANIDGVERSEWSGDADADADLGKMARAVGSYAASELGGGDAAASGAATDLGTADLASVDMAPMSDLDAAVQTADAVEQSMDSMTQDLTQDLP